VVGDKGAHERLECGGARAVNAVRIDDARRPAVIGGRGNAVDWI
jgi:hypothetical protein